jgi:hypothetical protein
MSKRSALPGQAPKGVGERRMPMGKCQWGRWDVELGVTGLVVRSRRVLMSLFSKICHSFL